MALLAAVEAPLGRAMTAAQVGRPDEAREALEEAARLVGEEASEERAALQAVSAFATLMRGDRDAVSAEAERCIATARRAGAPGWEVFALTLRVEGRMPTASDAGVLEDLLTAENALKRTTDPALRSWARTGLGLADASQRLFELAQPHQEAAMLEPLDPLGGLPETSMIPLYNLALTHLRWADELEQIGEEGQEGDVHSHRAIAAALATQAETVAVAEGADHWFVVQARLLRTASEWDDDPAAARTALERDLADFEALGGDDGWAGHASRLAEVLAALDETGPASDLALRAIEALPERGEPQTEAYVRHTALRLAAGGGDATAVAGLQYARVIARSWWSQRISRFESMRRALAADEIRRRHDHEHRAAREDALTRVGNLRAFEETMAALEGTPAVERGELAMLVVDVDRFKYINDRWGHVPGDETLRSVASVILAQTRGIDLVARVGGDEFVVVLAETDLADCRHVAQRLLDAIGELAETASQEHLRALTVSLGAASTSEGLGLRGLRAVADERMYAHKRDRQVPVRSVAPVGLDAAQASRATSTGVPPVRRSSSL